MINAHVTWRGGLRFEGAADSGHTVAMEAPVAGGPPTAAATPVEHTLIALCACTGVDVVAILDKMKVPPRALEVTAQAERAEKHPRVFTAIRMKFRVEGEVPPEKLERALELSARTYCSVGAMLGCTARISHEYEIVA